MIHGICKEGFESVKEIFTKSFENGIEDCAQLCVYMGDECIIDLWGSNNQNGNYNADSLQVIQIVMVQNRNF